MRPQVDEAVESLYRSEWGRIVATLIRLVGDFDTAEEAAQEAFTAAVNQWADDGIPDFPRAWIIQTARFKAIDLIRRRALHQEKAPEIAELTPSITEPNYDHLDIPDDRLRLIFTCCHPALAPEAQVALTLRTLGGLEPTRSRARSSSRPPPWRSASSAPRRRSATPASPTSSPPPPDARAARAVLPSFI